MKKIECEVSSDKLIADLKRSKADKILSKLKKSKVGSITLTEKIELLKALTGLLVINPYGGTLALVEKMIKEILDTITIS